MHKKYISIPSQNNYLLVYHHSGPHHQLHTFTVESTSTTEVNFAARPVLRARFRANARTYFPGEKGDVEMSSTWSDSAESLAEPTVTAKFKYIAVGREVYMSGPAPFRPSSVGPLVTNKAYTPHTLCLLTWCCIAT